MSDPKQPGFEGAPAEFAAELEPAPPLSEEEKAALLEVEADAGRVAPHSEVASWMRAVGTPTEFPMPESWLE